MFIDILERSEHTTLPMKIIVTVDPFDFSNVDDNMSVPFDSELSDELVNKEDYDKDGCVWKEFDINDTKFISILAASCVCNERIRKVVYEICVHLGNKFILTNEIFDLVDDTIKTALFQDNTFNELNKIK